MTCLFISMEPEKNLNAPGDYYWGCGADGSGQNKLGQTLMTVRTLLQSRMDQKDEISTENEGEIDDGKRSSDVA